MKRVIGYLMLSAPFIAALAFLAYRKPLELLMAAVVGAAVIAWIWVGLELSQGD